METPADGKKSLAEVSNSITHVQNGDVIIIPEKQQQFHMRDGLYEIDPFALQAAQKADDYVEFHTMGWVQAGCVATAEVRAIAFLFPTSAGQLG